jgi:hypothetical protein
MRFSIRFVKQKKHVYESSLFNCTLSKPRFTEYCRLFREVTDESVTILHVMHGQQDLTALFRDKSEQVSIDSFGGDAAAYEAWLLAQREVAIV